MTREELECAITETLDEINRLAAAIEFENDHRERKRLEMQKEVQIWQLWHMGQCGGW